MVDQYKKINNSYKRKLVYHLGSEAGFFSEYNNMILAMLYCLKHKIRFELYSKDANFGVKKGWEDYFEPFCFESLDPYHAKLNHRHPKGLTLKIKIITRYFKLTTKTTFLTYEIWPKFRNKTFSTEKFDIPSLEICGNVREAAGQLNNIIWNYNKPTANEVLSLILRLKLPEKYVGMHIRGGDKFIEWEKVEADIYMNIIDENSIVKDIFVLTDDYRIMIELKGKYPKYNFYSLCNDSEMGYYHAEFSRINSSQKRNDMIKLFASIDVLSKSELFVGTFSSNPGMYLGMRMDISKVKCVDLEKWCVW